MRAEELRIGNFVNTNDYINLEVLGISSTNVGLKLECTNFISVDYNELKPIPITVDWLLKFGFDLINNEYHQSRNHDLKLHWTVNKNKMIPEFNEKKFVTGYDFKYVHQLQNLYFVLTGNELICK